MPHMQDLHSIISNGPPITEAYDINTPEAHKYFNHVKEWIHGQQLSFHSLDLEAESLGNSALAFRTILKFIESEQIISNLKDNVTITLINPVYKEIGRMQHRSEHPHGENSLRTKISCLNYFSSVNPKFQGRVFVVDDECPVNSGEMAEKILSEFPGSDHKVFYLGKAIDTGDPDLPPGITHKEGNNRSVKGGSALFGMKKALNEPIDGRHIIIDNDADLSVHPMQIGLLIEPIVNKSYSAVAGSRREQDSIAMIGEGRNQRGALFIKLWQHFLPKLAESIIDTNRAFKAFDSVALTQILPSIQIYTFPYQIELLQSCISNGVPLTKKGIAYLDSEAASTQNGSNITETYLNQIRQIIDIAVRYNTIETSDPLLNYFRGISEEEWIKIESDPPENIKDLLD